MYILISITLFGCAASRDEVYLSGINGNTVISFVENTSFCLPGDIKVEELSPLGTFSDSISSSEIYVHRNEDLCTVFQWNNFFITELKTNVETKELFKWLEKSCNVRIMSQDLKKSYIDPDTYIEKYIYSVDAQVLLTDLLFDDYKGYLSIVKKGDVTCILFAGGVSDTDKDVLLDICKSFIYWDYDNLQNTGRGKRTDIKEDAKTGSVDIGEYGAYQTRYRGSGNISTEEFAILLKTVSLDGKIDKETNRLISKSSYRAFPPAPDGMKWGFAAFDLSYQGYDVSSSLPTVPMVICNTMRKQIASQFYVLEHTELRYVIAFLVPEGIEKLVFVVGIGDKPLHMLTE